METRILINNIISGLDERIKDISGQISDCPDGRLIITKNNGKRVIMHITGKGKDRTRRLITSDHNLQLALARREILTNEMEIMKKSRCILVKCVEELGQIEDLDRFRYIHGRFPWIVPEDIEKIFIPEKLRTWAEEEYERSDYRPYEKTIITSRGLAVRSKSELIIAELLYHYGIPFRYEQVIHVNEKLQIVPDFTIMCPDGTIIIWEHEGRTDKKSYMDWQRRKADYYAQLGYYPWDNLIITYDTADGNIDVRIVEAEIKNKILSKHGW